MKTTGWIIVIAIVAACLAAQADVKMIDEFNGGVNMLGCRHNCYQQPPSRAIATIMKDDVTLQEGEMPNRFLKIRYDKQNTGGKFGKGGWCGWYTLFYHPQMEQPKYLDINGKSKVTFKVKGEAGGENFRVNLKDKNGELADIPPPPMDVGTFLPQGQVTKDWQKVEIPLDTFFIDMTELASFSINFEYDCYPDGSSSGTIFVDELAFE